MNESFTVSGNTSHEVSFDARNIFIQNNTGAWIYARIGAQQIPDVNSNDLAVAPFTQVSRQITPATRFFGFSIGTTVLPTQGNVGAVIAVTFDDQPHVPLASNINLPGVTFTPAWYVTYVTVNHLTNVTLLTPPTGSQIVLFKLWANAFVTNNMDMRFVIPDDPYYIWRIFFYQTTYLAKFEDEISWLPQGFGLGKNISLNLKNPDATYNFSLYVGIFYATMPA